MMTLKTIFVDKRTFLILTIPDSLWSYHVTTILDVEHRYDLQYLVDTQKFDKIRRCFLLRSKFQYGFRLLENCKLLGRGRVGQLGIE